MTREQFKTVRFSEESLARIELCNDIIDKYRAQDLRLTLRQLYYQLVTVNAITNQERSYKALGKLVSDARLAGEMDWDAIEDRVRRPWAMPEWDGLPDLVETALASYRLPRWEGQQHYVELWIEKDALAGVLRPIAAEHHVTLMVNRGYSSQSAMYEAAGRLRAQADERHVTVLYLGDHDPSGEDMVRDIRDRLHMFGVNLDVDKVALTRKQVDKYQPPPNPAKLTDPRAEKYIAEHGAVSWEVDAIPPEELAKILRKTLAAYVDSARMAKVVRREDLDKKRLRIAVRDL